MFRRLVLILWLLIALTLRAFANQGCDGDTICLASFHLDASVMGLDKDELALAKHYLDAVDVETAEYKRLKGLFYVYAGNENDQELAESYLIEAHMEGDEFAAINLSEYYMSLGDRSKAREILDFGSVGKYEESSSKYFYWARAYSRFLYLYPERDTDRHNAHRLFEYVMSKDGSGETHYYIATLMYNDGAIGKAVELMKDASRFGLVEADLFLGDLYYIGDTVTVNRDLAMHYYEKAAEAGSGRAYYNMAAISRKAGDLNLFTEYLMHSANLGYMQAVEIYESLSIQADHK